MNRKVLVLGIGAGALAIVMSTAKSAGLVDHDLGHLVPAFRVKVEALLAAMRAKGFDPYVYETRRTPERAAQLAKAGVGIAKSLHILGAAVDIIDRAKHWDAPEAFWDCLRDEAEALGLVSGARWKHQDRDHVQAVSVADEPALRASADPGAFVALKLV